MELRLVEGPLFLGQALGLDARLGHPHAMQCLQGHGDDVHRVGAGADGAVAVEDFPRLPDLVLPQSPGFHHHEDEIRLVLLGHFLDGAGRIVLGLGAGAVQEDGDGDAGFEVAHEGHGGEALAVFQEAAGGVDERGDDLEVSVGDFGHSQTCFVCHG